MKNNTVNYQISIVDKFGVVLYRYCGDNYKINFYEPYDEKKPYLRYGAYIELPLLIDEVTKVCLYNTDYKSEDKMVALTKYLKLLLCASGNRIEIIESDGEISSLYYINELDELQISSSIQFNYVAYYMRIYFDSCGVIR